VSGGRADVVVPEGIVLGLRLPGSDALFEQVLQEQQLPLVAGDVIVLYTDGITEAANTDGEMFGDEALVRVVAGHHALGATGIRERVIREVAAFVGSAEAHDDMTMVVIRVAEGTGDV
jgi:sigma-B regulation protein RsbU (phosphoserine phosphatase)